MSILRPDEKDPWDRDSVSSVRDMRKNVLKEGEIIILKDGPEAKDWYCAEIRSILVDRVEVNYFTTQAPALEGYNECSEEARMES